MIKVRMNDRDEVMSRIADVRSVFMLDGMEEEMLDPGEAELLGRLAELIASRGLESAAHMRRIGDYSALLARASGLESEESGRIGMAAPLHDVGKVGIADEILFKQGELDPVEREEMQRHARAGHELLADTSSDVMRLAAEIALTHHERYDGSGYPPGPRGRRDPGRGPDRGRRRRLRRSRLRPPVPARTHPRGRDQDHAEGPRRPVRPRSPRPLRRRARHRPRRGGEERRHRPGADAMTQMLVRFRT